MKAVTSKQLWSIKKVNSEPRRKTMKVLHLQLLIIRVCSAHLQVFTTNYCRKQAVLLSTRTIVASNARCLTKSSILSWDCGSCMYWHPLACGQVQEHFSW